MDLVPPIAPMTMDSSVESYLQVRWAGIPLGRRIPTPGERCKWWRHDWSIEEYPGISSVNRDKVCGHCGDRKFLRRRQYRDGERPDYQAQVAAAIRNHTS